MYSGKAPLKAHANGGTSAESALFYIKDASTAVGLKQRQATSENCDPNLSVDRRAPRKGESSLALEESQKSAGSRSILQLSKSETGVAHSACEAAGELERQSKEATRSAKSFPSPTKVSASHNQHGHAHRHHFCRSPRCASNNPDYAVPAQTTPRKYLVSKRHLLPGAICTRDPAILANQTQESLVPLAPSTGKPPKPTLKLENGFHEPSISSLANVDSALLTGESPPTGISKPPSAHLPKFYGCATSPDRLCSATVLQPTFFASKACLPSYPGPFKQFVSEESVYEEETRFSRLGDRGGDRKEHLSCVDSQTYCSVLRGSSSCYTRAISVASVDTNLLEPSVIPPQKIESELSSLEKLFLPTFVRLADSRGSHQSFAEPECSSIAGTSSPLHLYEELENMTEKPVQYLAFEKAIDIARQVSECESREGIPITDVVASPSVIEDDSSISSALEVKEIFSNTCTRTPFAERNEDGKDQRFRGKLRGGDRTAKLLEGTDVYSKQRGCLISTSTPNFVSVEYQVPKAHRGVSKYVRGKGRQFWRTDCRDSREVVFLKQTSQTDRRPGDWTVDDILEGAISRLNPSGNKGKVRVLVEAFESLMHLGERDKPERRASRVWCLNRMDQGEVDEDGEEFDDGDQRVDCYEVSGDGLHLRASMRLSLGGGNRHALCSPDDASEIEMSAIRKVEDWNDDCHQSANPSDMKNSLEHVDHGYVRFQSSRDGAHIDGRRHDQSNEAEVIIGQGRMSSSCFSQRHLELVGNDRVPEDRNFDGRTVRQFSCHTSDPVEQRIDETKLSELRGIYKSHVCNSQIVDLEHKLEVPHRKRYLRANCVKTEHVVPCASYGGRVENSQIVDLEHKLEVPHRKRYLRANCVKTEHVVPCASYGGRVEKNRRTTRGTLLEPFHLVTEERGAIKEYRFAQKLVQMFADEERLRNPMAQGLPWTTDEPEVVLKPLVKEQTRVVEFRHYSNSRAIERAEFDNYLAKRSAYVELQRQEEQKLRQLVEQEEIKRLRREMVPQAQLMPFFDQPFIPSRSSKHLTVPKEPISYRRECKRAKCMVWLEQQQHHHYL